MLHRLAAVGMQLYDVTSARDAVSVGDQDVTPRILHSDMAANMDWYLASSLLLSSKPGTNTVSGPTRFAFRPCAIVINTRLDVVFSKLEQRKTTHRMQETKASNVPSILPVNVMPSGLQLLDPSVATGDTDISVVELRAALLDAVKLSKIDSATDG